MELLLAMKLPARDIEDIARRLGAYGIDELRGKSILITGGSGFIGRWMVESFAAFNDLYSLGARMFVLSRSMRTSPHPSVSIVEGDYTALASAEVQADYVIHAATASSTELALDPKLVVETIDGTRRALDFALRSRARRVLYLSSGAVYGTQTPYAETKRASELLCAMYSQNHGLHSVIARPFALLGPLVPLDTNLAVGNFIRDALEGKRVDVRGDGTPLRSYLYATDLAVWLWTILLRGAPGRAYDVGSEEEVSIAELAREAARLTDRPLEVKIHAVADPAKAPERYVPSTHFTRTKLGLTQTVDWRDALRRTYEWELLSGSAGSQPAEFGGLRAHRSTESVR